MKTIFSLTLILTFFFTSDLKAEEFNFIATKSKCNDEKPIAIKNGFLYSIEKRGKKSFLLGTIHGGISCDQFIGKNIERTLSRASKIFVEAKLEDEVILKETMFEFGIHTSGTNLRDMISLEYYNTFGKYLVEQRQILTKEQYEKSRPWFIAMLIPTSDNRTNKSLDWHWGTENQLIAFAKENNIEVDELEGIRFQFQLYDSMNESKQVSYFYDYFKLVQTGFIYEWQINVVDSWTSSDSIKLMRSLNALASKNNSYSNFYISRLIQQRNFTISRTISRVAKRQNNVLFAIGCEHLFGKNGVISSLQSEGYKVVKL